MYPVCNLSAATTKSLFSEQLFIHGAINAEVELFCTKCFSLHLNVKLLYRQDVTFYWVKIYKIIWIFVCRILKRFFLLFNLYKGYSSSNFICFFFHIWIIHTKLRNRLGTQKWEMNICLLYLIGKSNSALSAAEFNLRV